MRIRMLQGQAGYWLMAILAIAIGLYPLRFIGLPSDLSILGGKADILAEYHWYLAAFYLHIGGGGIALISGFSQFFPGLRNRYLRLHRALGQVYVVAVLLSGFSGLAIAYFAEGGLMASLGFGSLAILWLYTTLMAYRSARSRRISLHRNWMIRSYALCFAAVTLRLYLPLGVLLFDGDFLTPYRWIAWLCWVPNLLLAEFLLIRRPKIA